MRYLVTGGAGFIGSHLVDLLTSRGDRVVVLDDLSTGRLSNLDHLLPSGLVELVEGSVLDKQAVEESIAEVDGCFHLASVVGVRLIVDRPLDSLLTNVRGCDIVMNAAARGGIRLLFTSTSEVYGKNSQGTLSEDADRLVGSPFKARWSYAIAKSFGEALVHTLAREREAEMCVARLFNTVGPRQSGDYGMVLPRLVRQALTGQELTVYGNGTQMRCFTHVLDTVQALVLLMDHERSSGRAFNIGSEIETPIIELARRVLERTGSSSAVRLVPYETAYQDGFEELGRRRPDTGAVKDLCGWQPARTVDTAIDDIIAYEQTVAPAGEPVPAGNGRLASGVSVGGNLESIER